MDPGGTAPGAISKLIAMVPGLRVISNSRQRSGLVVPQQLRLRTTNGEIHVPDGLAVRSTVKNGTPGSHRPDWALVETGIANNAATMNSNAGHLAGRCPNKFRNPIILYICFMAQYF
ncbi:hypothetical protein SDC9_59140 [bioreactor metagenome]|uniref:Uncharacterized protein n=1 Tax=bioreactor metagenome TaxID=1076179 RepID=A0A644X9D0_9ZZZZ